MTRVSTSDLQRLATLSGLKLADDEQDGLRQNLEDIIKYIEQLSELDTTDVEPTYQVTGLENVWREDEIDQPLERESLLKPAPDQKNNQVKVPKVL